jgi:hypothetical protein
MRTILTALLTIGAIAAAVPALAFDDPKDVIWALYTPFTKSDWEYVDPAPLQSVGLNQLIEMDRKDADDEIGRIDFDPYVNGQDALISDIELTDTDMLGGTARIAVTFKNFDVENQAIFSLVKERDGWKIDDVVNLEADGDVGYSYRDILTSPFP